MEYKTLLTQQTGSILTVTFNNPDKLNALTSEFLEEYNRLLSSIEFDDAIKVVILTGKGKAFIAGADIALMSEMTPLEAARYADVTTRNYSMMESMNKVFIAAINGYAFGGGMEISLACDLRVASARARMGLTEVSLGIIPGGGGTQRLPRLIGMTKAKELIYTGRSIKAEEALELGILNAVVEPEELESYVNELAQSIIANGFTAVALAKQAMNYGAQTDLKTAIKADENLFAMCFSTADQREGMQAFLEKRKPNYQ